MGRILFLNIEYANWNGKARSIARPANSIKSVFDYGPGLGRVRKRIYQGTTPTISRTIYSTGALEIEEVTATTTTQTKRFINTAGVGLLYRLEDDTFYWILPDHLGSTRMIIDEVVEQLQRLYSYDIYGTPIVLQINPNDDLVFLSSVHRAVLRC